MLIIYKESTHEAKEKKNKEFFKWAKMYNKILKGLKFWINSNSN